MLFSVKAKDPCGTVQAMTLLAAAALSFAVQAEPCDPLNEKTTISDLNQLLAWGDTPAFASEFNRFKPTPEKSKVGLEATGWMRQYAHGLLQVEVSLGKLASSLEFGWMHQENTGKDHLSTGIESSADVVETTIRYGRPEEHVEIALAAGVGFEWGRTWTDVDQNGIPELRMTRRILTPVQIVLQYEDIEQVMSRERYREIESKSARMANERYGWFWPSQEKSNYYQAIKKTLLEKEAQQ